MPGSPGSTPELPEGWVCMQKPFSRENPPAPALLAQLPAFEQLKYRKFVVCPITLSSYNQHLIALQPNVSQLAPALLSSYRLSFGSDGASCEARPQGWTAELRA